MGFLSSFAGIFTRPAAPPPVTQPAGSDGIWAPGGFVVGGERNPTLQGRNKWLAYDNTLANTITVAAMARIWGALLGGAKWVVEPNPAGGAKPARAAELVREGLVDAHAHAVELCGPKGRLRQQVPRLRDVRAGPPPPR